MSQLEGTRPLYPAITPHANDWTSVAKEIESEVRRYAPKALSATAYLLLLFLADSANIDDRITCLSLDTSMKDTRASRTAVYDAYKQLSDLNIVRTLGSEQIPERVRHYKSTVRQILPVEEWKITFDRHTNTDVVRNPDSGVGGGVRIPDPQQSGIRTEQGPDSVPKPNTYNQEQENLKKPSASYFGRAAEVRHDVPRKGRRRGINPDAELDPADTVGAAIGVKREAPAPKVPASDTASGLARHFAATLRRSTHRLPPDPINYAALGAALGRWLEEGLSPTEIRSMIAAYCEAGPRPGVAPWRDFLARRVSLATATESNDLAFIYANPNSPEALAYYGLSADDLALFDHVRPENPPCD